MEYETLLKDTGGFGRLQIVMMFLFGSLTFKAMVELQLFVLMQSSPEYRCTQQNSSNYEAQEFGFHCDIMRFTNESNATNQTNEACRQFEYRPLYLKKTLTDEYDTVCDRAYYATLMSSLYFLGHCVGILLSTLGDRIGRKAIFYGAGLLDLATTLLPVFMPSVEWQIASRFLIGIPTPAYSQGLLLMYEFTMQQHRGLVGSFYWLFWCAGYVSSALLAFLLQDWRKIQLVSCVFCISYPLIYIMVPESPRWLVLKGRTEDATKVFQRLAKWNGVTWTPSKLMDIKVEPEPTGRMQELFTQPQIRKKTLIISWMMLVLSVCYYGVSIDSSFLSENIFINTAISGALEVPSYLLSAPLCNKLGRRWPTIGATAASGATIMVSAFLPYGAAKMVVASAGKILLTTAYTIMSLLSAELFPTSVRNSGMYLTLLLGTLLTTMSPVIVSLGAVQLWLPGVLFGGVAAASSGLVYLLPETLGLPLPETVEQSEALYRGNEEAWLKAANPVRPDAGNLPVVAGQNGAKAKQRNAVEPLACV